LQVDRQHEPSDRQVPSHILEFLTTTPRITRAEKALTGESSVWNELIFLSELTTNQVLIDFVPAPSHLMDPASATASTASDRPPITTVSSAAGSQLLPGVINLAEHVATNLSFPSIVEQPSVDAGLVFFPAGEDDVLSHVSTDSDHAQIPGQYVSPRADQLPPLNGWKMNTAKRHHKSHPYGAPTPSGLTFSQFSNSRVAPEQYCPQMVPTYLSLLSIFLTASHPMGSTRLLKLLTMWVLLLIGSQNNQVGFPNFKT